MLETYSFPKDTEELAMYIRKQAKATGSDKSKYIRKLIREDMNKQSDNSCKSDEEKIRNIIEQYLSENKINISSNKELIYNQEDITNSVMNVFKSFDM